MPHEATAHDQLVADTLPHFSEPMKGDHQDNTLINTSPTDNGPGCNPISHVTSSTHSDTATPLHNTATGADQPAHSTGNDCPTPPHPGDADSTLDYLGRPRPRDAHTHGQTQDLPMLYVNGAHLDDRSTPPVDARPTPEAHPADTAAAQPELGPYTLHHSADYTKWPTPTCDVAPETAGLYRAARRARVNGTQAPTLVHTTDLIVDEWRAAATAHPHDRMVLNGIQHGFSIQYRGPPITAPAAAHNHQSALGFAEHIDRYVETETDKGALSGPYDKPPFTPWFTASPLMSREKPGGEGRRVIVDLSFPDGGVNKFIPPHLFDGQDAYHNLPTIAAAVDTIASTCPGDVTMAVIDLSRAYRQFPVDPLDWPLLGIHWRGRWSFDRRLPFGCRMSSFIMQRIADFLVRALATKGIRSHMYLDDIIMVSPTATTAQRDYSEIISMLARLGLAVAHKKLQPPASSVTWLGITIDIPGNVMSIQDDKLDQIRSCMAAAAQRTYLNKKHLQRLIGLANHLAKIIRGARIFICRLLAALRATTGEVILVSKEAKADLNWFVQYLADANGKAVIPCRRVVLRIWADACLKGSGASDGQRYYEFTFPRPLADGHIIAHLEALNCLAAARLFVDRSTAGGIVEIMCDNRPSVDAFTSGRARDPVLAACARALWFVAAKADAELVFTHVPGEGMALPDALSRASLDSTFRARADAFIADLGLVPVIATSAHFDYHSLI